VRSPRVQYKSSPVVTGVHFFDNIPKNTGFRRSGPILFACLESILDGLGAVSAGRESGGGPVHGSWGKSGGITNEEGDGSELHDE
jgi:hypothetical protein